MALVVNVVDVPPYSGPFAVKVSVQEPADVNVRPLVVPVPPLTVVLVGPPMVQLLDVVTSMTLLPLPPVNVNVIGGNTLFVDVFVGMGAADSVHVVAVIEVASAELEPIPSVVPLAAEPV